VKDINLPKKPLTEAGTLLICIGLSASTCTLSFLHLLHPVLLFVFLGLQAIIAALTRIEYNTPHPWAHFHRNWEGLIFAASLIAALFYYVTYFSEGMTPIAAFRADLMLVYAYFLCLWVLLADLPVIGLYFAVTVFSKWSILFVHNYAPIDLPFIFYISGTLFSLMGVGMWFTSTVHFLNAIRRKDAYGIRAAEYHHLAQWLFPVKIFIGLVIIVFENTLMSWILTAIPFDLLLMRI
jgi:hypothetical protein